MTQTSYPPFMGCRRAEPVPGLAALRKGDITMTNRTSNEEIAAKVAKINAAAFDMRQQAYALLGLKQRTIARLEGMAAASGMRVHEVIDATAKDFEKRFAQMIKDPAMRR